MNPTPINEARRALELGANAVVKICQSKIMDAKVSGVSLLGAIHRFVRTVESNVHLDRARSDCLAEYQTERSALFRQKRQLVTDLCSVRQAAQAAFPVLDGSAIPAAIPSVESHYSLARFDGLAHAILEERVEIDEGGVSDASPTRETLADVLWVILAQGLPKLGVDSNDERLVALLEQLGPIRDDIRRTLRSQSLLDSVNPTAGWLWLRQVVADCNPTVNSDAWTLGAMGDVQPYAAYFRFLYSAGGVKTEDLAWLEGFRLEVAAKVVAVRSELEARLGTRASAVWVLQRYARRCRWLRLDELGAPPSEAAEGFKRREVDFTRDAATYLFDQGFDVRIEESHGQHRYDMLTPSLLVEAKVYSAKRRPLDAVVDGLKQIHQYATALNNEGLTPEPILVLFRLDGPVADGLREYTIGNVRVSLQWIDLGPSGQSGSRASPPDITVTAAEIDRKLSDLRIGAKG